MLIIGNKSDLSEKRIIEEKKGKEIAEKMGVDFMETSAIDYKSTSNVFDNLIIKILKRKKKELGQSFMISSPSKKKIKRKFDCC